MQVAQQSGLGREGGRQGRFEAMSERLKLTDEQRALLEQFERSADDDTYRPDEGFFDKLKSAFR